MAQNAYKKSDGGYEKYRAEQRINPSNSTVNGQKRGNNEVDEQYAIEQDVHSYMVGKRRWTGQTQVISGSIEKNHSGKKQQDHQ